MIGDLHSNWGALLGIAQHARDHLQADAVVQVGDLDGCAAGLAALQARGVLAVPVHVVDGNHDDHVWWNDPTQRALAAQMGVHLLSRGTVATIAGERIGVLGGAANVFTPERSTVLAGTTITNRIRPDDVHQAVQAWGAERPALVVTHTVPSDIPIKGLLPSQGTEYGDAALRAVRGQLGYAPAHWVFGHFHPPALLRHEEGGTTFWCLPKAERVSQAILVEQGRVTPVNLAVNPYRAPARGRP
jgi:hypothetical protein